MIVLDKIRMNALDFLTHAIEMHIKFNGTMPKGFGLPQQTIDELHKDKRVFYSKFRSFLTLRMKIKETERIIYVFESKKLPHLVDKNHDEWSI